MAQRWLIGLGSLFLLLGILLLASTVLRPLADHQLRGRAAAVDEYNESLATDAENAPSPAWSAAAGISLALGAGLFGIGMNRWRRGPNPADARRA
jgi:hypothetical protein